MRTDHTNSKRDPLKDARAPPPIGKGKRRFITIRATIVLFMFLTPLAARDRIFRPISGVFFDK
jgi:hypothetical protein